jgi:TctA family transporter
MAIRFGPVEIFALVLFGLSTICGLAEKSLLRGLIAGVLGLLVMTIGLDPYAGVPRMTFGSTTFLQGVDLLVAMVGLFAVPQIIHTLVDWRGGREIQLKPERRAELPSLRQLKENFGVMMRSAAIGTGIGAIPGAGGPIASFSPMTRRAGSPRKGEFRQGRPLRRGGAGGRQQRRHRRHHDPASVARHPRRSGHRDHPRRPADPWPGTRAAPVHREPGGGLSRSICRSSSPM